MINTFPQALTIGGSDSDGSAGIQADLLTFFNLHVHGSSIITACVSGNSYGIHQSVLMPIKFITQEFKDLADDYNIKASKTGMLGNAEIIDTVVNNYKKENFGPLVVDPVIITKHGDTLLEEKAYKTLVKKLIPMAEVLTPNFYEAKKLTNLSLENKDSIIKAATILQDLGASNIVIKGKHDSSNQNTVKDYVLLKNGKSFWMSSPYYNTQRKNGTGDTLSAAITAELAKGNSVEQSIKIAKEYVDKAIKNEIQVGHKFGPINHWN